MSDSAVASPAAAEPLGEERIAAIDVLRGVAVLGILIVNIGAYAFPYMFRATGQYLVTPEDHLVGHLVRLLAEMKFFPLFSMMFGVGLFVQMERAEARGVAFAPLYLRRLLFLGLFGLAHGLLIWPGDVLLLYAIVGTSLLLFRGVRPRWLVLWAVALFAVTAFGMFAVAGLIALAVATPEGARAIQGAWAGELGEESARAIEVYANGTAGELLSQRFSDWVTLQSNGVASAPIVLAMFLAGLAAAKSQLFGASEQARSRRRWLMIVGGLLGVPLAFVYDQVTRRSLGVEFSGLMMVSSALAIVSGPVLTLLYVSALTSLTYSRLGGLLRATFAPVGRMSLSNYLLHSVAAWVIFLSHGFGLFGQVPYAVCAVGALGLFVLQVVASRWWIARFRFGPAEWLWRSLTYGARQPLRRAPSAAAVIAP